MSLLLPRGAGVIRTTFPPRAYPLRRTRRRGLSRIRYQPLDVLWGKVIRARDPICVFQFVCKGHRAREAAHLVADRNRWSVRWEMDNGVGSCFLCHRWADQHKTERAEFALKRLGPERYTRLLVRSQLTEKQAGVDRTAVKAYLTQRLKDLYGSAGESAPPRP